MTEMDFVKQYVDDNYGKNTTFDELGELVIKAKHIFSLRQMSRRLAQIKRNRFKLVSNWEVDDYYERKLKKYDTE